MPTKSMLLIANPRSGQGKFVDDFFGLVEFFVKQGFEVTVYPTTGPRHAHQVTLERAGGFDYLVCCGGDGTLNEVISALMLLERRPLLGHIPYGSSNDFAATHGLLADVMKGAQLVADGKPTAIDIGAFQEDRFFCYVAAFGLFSDVSYDTPQSRKNVLGHLAYVLQGVKKLGSIRHHSCRIELDGEVIEDDFIFGMIANSRSVGGFGLPFEIDVCLDDGEFELVLLRRIHTLEKLAGVISTLLGGKGPPDSSFVMRRAKNVRIICDKAISWSIDGEYGGSHKVTEITARQKAIEIITPHDTAAPAKKGRRTLRPRTE